MNAENLNQDPGNRARELLRSGAKAELELLRRERKAERRLAGALEALASDKARVRKTQERLERSREGVAAAQAKLREAQASRAAGPTGSQD